MKTIRLFLLLVLITSCSGNDSSSPDSEQMVMSTLWYQHSAEMRALYYQAFNIAEYRIDQLLKDSVWGKKPAVIVDIDETMLDNSPSEALNILEGERYSKDRWRDWTGKASAKPLPGSLEFANYLSSMNVELFYVSNRGVDELDATIENLNRYNFPFADKQHVFLKTDTSNKEARRKKVADNYSILLLIGDNLGDFAEVFDDRSDNLGKENVDEYRKAFGEKFIVLPNPLYGSWTSALHGSLKNKSPKEIAELRKQFLTAY